MIKYILLTLSLTLFTYLPPAKANEIIVWNRLSDNPVSYKILQLALDKTKPTYGPYTLKSSIAMEQGRVINELKRNQRVHVASFAPTNKRESELLPVRIPVTRGLLGLRVCLIKEGNQHRFTNADTLQQWNKQGLSIGQGRHWPDTAILEANNINVVKSTKYMTLFVMLTKNRFDCFSRSVSEVLPELNKHKNKGIALEQEHLLVYRLPTFFFVSRLNKPLAQRIEKGLRLANMDGSFSKIIRLAYRDNFKNLKLNSRKTIYLDNPYLSNETSKILQEDSLWLNPLTTNLILHEN